MAYQRVKKVLFGVFLFAGTLGIMLTLAEGLVAHFAVIDTPPGLFRASSTRSFEHRPGFKGRDRYRHPIMINSRGLRDREFDVPKPAGVYRILVLGDSVTFGDGVRAEETYPKELERILNAERRDDLRVEVLNTGVRGYNTLQEFLLFTETGAAYDPDLVILGYVLNDAEPLDKQAGLISPRFAFLIPVKNWVREHSYLYAFLRRTLDLFRQRNGSAGGIESYEEQFAPDHPGWKASREAMAGLAAAVRSQDSDFLLAVIPRFESLEEGVVYPWERMHAQIVEAARGMGIRTLDLLPFFRGQPSSDLTIVPTDSFHPNPAGHRLIARRLADEIRTAFLPELD